MEEYSRQARGYSSLDRSRYHTQQALREMLILVVGCRRHPYSQLHWGLIYELMNKMYLIYNAILFLLWWYSFLLGWAQYSFKDKEQSDNLHLGWVMGQLKVSICLEHHHFLFYLAVFVMVFVVVLKWKLLRCFILFLESWLPKLFLVFYPVLYGLTDRFIEAISRFL